MTGLQMSTGVLVLLRSVLRIAWRPFARSFPRVDGPPFLRLLTKGGHAVLYVAMAAVPSAEMLMVWPKGGPVSFFGLSIPAPFVAARELAKPLAEVHEIAADLTMIMAGLHAAAAIGHHFLIKDRTLARMMPFGGRTARVR